MVFQNDSTCLDICGSSQLAGGHYNNMCQVFNINAFPVGVNGVKPDFKAVSARLDAQEETRSEPQRVSHLCVCVNAA